MALGATRSLPELYAAAGVTLSFDVTMLRDLVEMIEEEMAVLRRRSARSPEAAMGYRAAPGSGPAQVGLPLRLAGGSGRLRSWQLIESRSRSVDGEGRWY